ncbi:MAG: DUF1934 domain-containing protein [Oscillospiraceae bacterium]
MIKDNATISLISTQSDGQNSDQSEMITQGHFEKKDDRFVISYKETEATGFDGSFTELSIYGNKKIVLNRTGDFMSNLIVETGKKHYCQYGTPYGEIVVGVNSKEINSELDEKGGRVNFKYVIDVNSSYVGDFDVTIDVKQQ